MFKTIKIIFIAGVLCMLAFYVYVKIDSKEKCTHDINKVPKHFVAIVFGAGIKNGQPSKYLRDRLNAGIELYTTGKVDRLLLSGDNGRDEYDEIDVMKNYCRDHGVDTNHIFVDYAGFDTYSTLKRAQKVFLVDSAILVSQRYHLERAIFIAKEMGLHVIGYEADKGTYKWHFRNIGREVLATSYAGLELLIHRQPKFLGPEIDIKGNSNFSKKI